MIRGGGSFARQAWCILSLALTSATAGCGGENGPTTPAGPVQLAFTVQPTTTTIEATISPAVQVEIQDAAGVRVVTARNPVTLTIGTNPSGGTLFGTTTVNAVDGIASFSGLAITKPDRRYALVASSGSLTPATSVAFNVVLGFAELSAGDIYTCGLTTRGAAYCWGDNFYGQLGHGTRTGSTVPVLVSGGLSFAALSAGGSHTCGVTTAGTAYCWGNNSSGQLGDGTTTQRSSPVLAAGGVYFRTLSTGTAHTCGIVVTAAFAYCWGDNSTGQLGDGTTTQPASPVVAAGGVAFVTLITGQAHTCGITGAGALCWGFNGYGQLGDGTTTDRASAVLVTGGVTFAALTGGGSHTCGVTAAGAASCWGLNELGELGNGSTTNSSVPTLVAGGLSFAALNAGIGNVHTCGLTTGGSAYCWGFNSSGQLGDGTTTSSSVPVLVSGG